jgi:uncharacterized protein
MAPTSEDRIRAFVDEVARQFDPEQIILFGSHARAEGNLDSDVDLLVVMDFQGRPHRQAYEIRRRVARSFPLDLLVRRPREIKRRLKMRDFFIKEIIENGKVLYERTGR